MCMCVCACEFFSKKEVVLDAWVGGVAGTLACPPARTHARTDKHMAVSGDSTY